MSEMSKAEIVAELEAMAWSRLFNCRQWLPDQETFYAINLKLTKMGLTDRTHIVRYLATYALRKGVHC